MDCSPPGSSVHGVSQARILEWVAVSSSRGPVSGEDGAEMKGGSASLKRTLFQGTGEPWGGVRQRTVDPDSCASDLPRVPCGERFAGGPERKQERQLRDDCRV